MLCRVTSPGSSRESAQERRVLIQIGRVRAPRWIVDDQDGREGPEDRKPGGRERRDIERSLPARARLGCRGELVVRAAAARARVVRLVARRRGPRASVGEADTVSLLLERGADPSAKNNPGQTALDIAKRKRHGNRQEQNSFFEVYFCIVCLRSTDRIVSVTGLKTITESSTGNASNVSCGGDFWCQH